MTDTVTSAVAKRDTGPSAVIEQYRGDLSSVLPSHIKPETWVRVAISAVGKSPELYKAATANPRSMMAALMTAARLGLEPGTEEYYLTPRKTKNGPEVLGIPGYQGIVELIYRAGAVSTVIVEVVREGDKFSYVPGRDERPIHEIDWFGADRGALVGAYAYAVMKDGAVSKVVVLSKQHIELAKKSSQGADSQYSPWQQHEEAMWLKTAARRLSKWVPTSSEYVREQLRAVRDVQAEGPKQSPEQAPIDVSGLQEVDPDVMDGEVVEPELWPQVTQPGQDNAGSA